MLTGRRVLLVLLVVLLAGCAHHLVLTAGGTSVQVLERAHLPEGCRVIADVSIGVPPDAAVAATEAELTVLLRNKAAELGADHLVVERTERRPGADGTDRYFGSGSAYACTAETGLSE